MNHSARSSLRAPAAIVVLLLAVNGCGPHQRVETATSGTLNPPKGVATGADTSRALILRQAEALYDYGPERAPVTGTYPEFPGTHVPDGTIPTMRIATARWKGPGPMPPGRIIARIYSERAYTPMGIAAGYNYVWRNSWDTTAVRNWQSQVVSRDRSVSAHNLVRDSTRAEYSHGDAMEPRLVLLKVASMGLGLCLDDPMCGTGHCGYY